MRSKSTNPSNILLPRNNISTYKPTFDYDI